MNILAVEDPDLHQKLQPQFQLIQGKRNGAIAGGVTLSAIGGILMLVARDDNSSDQIRFGRGASHPDVGLMLSGLMVMSIGRIIAVIFNPRENDFLDFFNLHNRNSKNQKIQWRMGLNVWGNNAQGIRLQLQF